MDLLFRRFRRGFGVPRTLLEAAESFSTGFSETEDLLVLSTDLPGIKPEDIAISVEVQAIGGVNQKIEGFFDCCRHKGLSGDPGVIIPASNVKDLMLRKDVVEAVKEGKFIVYSVKNIDEGIEILSGKEASALQ